MFDSVFDHECYKKYLALRLSTSGVTRGVRAKLARTLKVQPAYISQILNGATHVSLEHAAAIDQFLDHAFEESHYFLLLVHHARAGNPSLRTYYSLQMEELRRSRKLVAERIRVEKGLTRENQSRYYQHWYYGAIHALVMIPKYQTEKAITDYLKIPGPLVKESLKFLEAVGLLKEEKGKYTVTEMRLHLQEDSHMISQHHTNWRMRALQALHPPRKESLHFSGAVALSRENVRRVRAVLLEALEKMEPILAEPDEEEAYCICLDYFQL
jgi:uncharacterized protein (TIGR02147 family)